MVSGFMSSYVEGFQTIESFQEFPNESDLINNNRRVRNNSSEGEVTKSIEVNASSPTAAGDDDTEFGTYTTAPMATFPRRTYPDITVESADPNYTPPSVIPPEIETDIPVTNIYSLPPPGDTPPSSIPPVPNDNPDSVDTGPGANEFTDLNEKLDNIAPDEEMDLDLEEGFKNNSDNNFIGSKIVKSEI